MAGGKDASKDASAGPATKVAAPAPAREKLTDKQLAKAVLAGTLKPRVGEVRQLAEAVLKKGAPKPVKKAKRKKAKSGKLAKIPRQKK